MKPIVRNQMFTLVVGIFLDRQGKLAAYTLVNATPQLKKLVASYVAFPMCISQSPFPTDLLLLNLYYT